MKPMRILTGNLTSRTWVGLAVGGTLEANMATSNKPNNQPILYNNDIKPIITWFTAVYMIQKDPTWEWRTTSVHWCNFHILLVGRMRLNQPLDVNHSAVVHMHALLQRVTTNAWSDWLPLLFFLLFVAMGDTFFQLAQYQQCHNWCHPPFFLLVIITSLCFPSISIVYASLVLLGPYI